MPRKTIILLLFLLALLTGGCAATYVPISWGMGDKIRDLSRTDVTLVALFDRYDPDRKTLRVDGASYDEVMMPKEVDYHLGAYRPDTKLIYRNLYREYTDTELRDLMVHEFAHHIWFTVMSREQRERWRLYLIMNPSPLQEMVRRTYRYPSDYDTEDFAFTVQFARPIDIEELARMGIITGEERDAILKEPRMLERIAIAASHPSGALGAAGSKLASPADDKVVNKESEKQQ